MLTAEQTNELRARLQADLTRLADHAHAGLEFTMDRDRDRDRPRLDGRVDRGGDVLHRSSGSTTARRSCSARSSEAMRRLEAGEIDECEECAEPIGFKRLMARPVTTLCFECKTAREQVEADERPE